jgi:hypothetical protein
MQQLSDLSGIQPPAATCTSMLTAAQPRGTRSGTNQSFSAAVCLCFIPGAFRSAFYFWNCSLRRYESPQSLSIKYGAFAKAGVLGVGMWVGAENAYLLCHFVPTNDRFTKTGSGQT